MKNPFDGHLLSGETIVWSGRPYQGLMLTFLDLFIIPFSMLWGGFAVFWEIAVLSMGAPFFMVLFGIPFVVAGLFLIFGRFLLDAWLRTKVHYALTDRRILILRDGSFGAFRAVDLDQLPDATLTESHDGSGTIRLPQKGQFWAASGVIPTLDPTPQLLGIADARRVFAMIQERTHRARSD